MKIRQGNMCNDVCIKNFVQSVCVTVKHPIIVRLNVHIRHCCWTVSIRGTNDGRCKTHHNNWNKNASLGERNISEGRFRHQDDNGPCHRAKVVQNWFVPCGIILLQWPRQSPELSQRSLPPKKILQRLLLQLGIKKSLRLFWRSWFHQCLSTVQL